jgi:hypothetical protein
MTDTEQTREPEPDEAEREAADEPAPAEDAADRPRKRKKKRKKRKKRHSTPGLRPTRDAQERDRPAFLLAFPRDPELERLIEAYEAGDYATVRREAPGLAERTEDRAVRDAALELRRRIDPDPLARYLLLTAVALLVFLVIWVYAKQGH